MISKMLWTLGASLITAFSAVALTNAQPALDAHYEAQAMIRSEGRSSNGESAPDYCNATVVSPRILVTAAHCVAQSWYLRDNVIEVSVGRYKYVTRPNGQVVRVGYANYLKSNETAQILLSPTLQRSFQNGGVMTDVPPAEDYAVVILSRQLPLPTDFPYRRMVSQAQLTQVISAVAQLSPTIVTVNPWEEVSTSDTKRFAVLNQISYNSSGWFESKSTARVQEGDSGGGLLVKVGNEYQLVAVVKGKASSLFSNWDVYTVAVGKVCELVQNAGLNVDEKATLCR